MIFYFSGTGNSRWVAKEVSTQIGERLINIQDAIKEDCGFSLEKEERLGFVFPVHGWRIPNIVTAFLDKLKLTSTVCDECYSFCIVTAGDTIGRTMERFEKKFLKINTNRKLSLHAVASFIMPESYVGLPGMDVDTKEKEKNKITLAQHELKRFIETISERRSKTNEKSLGWNELHRGPFPDFFSGIIGAFFQKVLITDKPFRVVDERCVKCGICANVCPVNNIVGELGMKPTWKHNKKCLTCFACYHHCPHHAIEFGHQTKNKGQYFFGRRKLHSN